MSKIRIDLDGPVYNGQPVTFRSPSNCSNVESLVVYYYSNGVETSSTFQLTDAHGNNVAGADLFAGDVLVRVILDTESRKAFVQNADTNAYLEAKFQDIDKDKAPAYTYGTEDLTPGESPLETGKLYFVYE